MTIVRKPAAYLALLLLSCVFNSTWAAPAPIVAGTRLSVMPEVPTLTEAGLGQAKVASWFALAAPAGTPADIVQKLRDAFIKASQDPELKRRLTENGTLIHTSTSEEMAKLLAEEVESTNQLVKALGLRQQ